METGGIREEGNMVSLSCFFLMEWQYRFDNSPSLFLDRQIAYVPRGCLVMVITLRPS